MQNHRNEMNNLFQQRDSEQKKLNDHITKMKKVEAEVISFISEVKNEQ
jgi:hypothetical protein